MVLTSNIMMVRPSSFGFNLETAPTNDLQHQQPCAPAYSHRRACYEFDRFIAILRAHHITPLIIQDRSPPVKPDAIFSNNWISTHANGAVFLYPMATVNRQAERNFATVAMLKKNFHVKKIIDISGHDFCKKPLEGTGSLVLDRENHYAYACLSSRTHSDTLGVFVNRSGYRPVVFNAYNRQGSPYYHTNIIMSMGDRFALLCLKSIVDPKERKKVISALEKTNKEIIAISIEQAENYFLGNALLLKNKKGKKLLILSSQAHQSLTPYQRLKLEQHTHLLPVSIPFIEAIGGGSVRCMITEIFLPKQRARTPQRSPSYSV